MVRRFRGAPAVIRRRASSVWKAKVHRFNSADFGSESCPKNHRKRGVAFASRKQPLNRFPCSMIGIIAILLAKPGALLATNFTAGNTVANTRAHNVLQSSRIHQESSKTNKELKCNSPNRRRP